MSAPPVDPAAPAPPPLPGPQRTPGVGWVVGLVSPLWFLWRRQYLLFAAIVIAIFVNSWLALVGFETIPPWPQALWFTLFGVVVTTFAGIVPAMSDTPGDVIWGINLAQAVAAFLVHRFQRPIAGPRYRDLAVVVGGLALGVLGFTRMRVPGTKPRAYLASMQNDLRNLLTAQEAYFADRISYSDNLDSVRFEPSTGVTVTIGAVSGTGWNATAKHNATQRICAIYVGSAPPPLPDAQEGEPKCVLPR